MGRKHTIRQAELPYHITTRSNMASWFTSNLDEIWNMVIQALAFAQQKHSVTIYAFVLMNNHYHLIVKTPLSNIDKFMYEFNKWFSIAIREESGLINRMFGSRYKWTIIDSQKYFLNVMRYVFQNPLRADIVDRCELYTYSTLYFHFKKMAHYLPFHVEWPLPSTIKEKVIWDWLNTCEDESEFKQCKNRLGKKYFSLNKN